MDALKIIEYLARFIAVMIVISCHEFAHAFAAVKNGDETPRINGRYTLNPFAHVDLVGILMMFFVGFGWARPVPINPYNFKNIKKGYFWTSAAGVITNILLAFLTYPLIRIFSILSFDLMLFDELLYFTLQYCFILNLCFFVFNLIPVFPLDGFRVLEVIVKTRGKVMTFLREKGQYVLLVLVGISFLADYISIFSYIDILGYLMSFVTNIVAWPIMKFWNLIFNLF